MENRIIALETKISYIEDSVAQLNSLVIEQQKSLAERDKKIELLINLFREMKESSEMGEMLHQKPPHY